jgi:hypothetical protein
MALDLNVLQELQHRRSIHIGHKESSRLSASRLLKEAQQKPEGISIAQYCAWAGSFVVA